MSNQLGPIEIECDAPPYTVVRACRRIGGMQSPEDVRWCRVGRFTHRPTGWRALMRQFWNLLLGRGFPGEKTCFCGGDLPRLEDCTFTFITGRKTNYRLGQCTRCQTIFWEET